MRIRTTTNNNNFIPNKTEYSLVKGDKVKILNYGIELSIPIFIIEDVVWCEYPYARLSLRGDGQVVHNITLSSLEKI